MPPVSPLAMPLNFSVYVHVLFGILKGYWTNVPIVLILGQKLGSGCRLHPNHTLSMHLTLDCTDTSAGECAHTFIEGRGVLCVVM